MDPLQPSGLLGWHIDVDANSYSHDSALVIAYCAPAMQEL